MTRVFRFMEGAPDRIQLLIQVAAIFGLAGACRRDELCRITVDHIEDKKNSIVVQIPESENNTSRIFEVSNESNKGHYLQFDHKYANLRKSYTPPGVFSVRFRQGACSTQCVGINLFGKMPSKIAAYLQLKNAEQYIVHSFHRSSATILADSGAEITNVKRL